MKQVNLLLLLWLWLGLHDARNHGRLLIHGCHNLMRLVRRRVHIVLLLLWVVRLKLGMRSLLRLVQELAHVLLKHLIWHIHLDLIRRWALLLLSGARYRNGLGLLLLRLLLRGSCRHRLGLLG